MTAQSYSQALPFIKAITQTEAGLLIAPYVRFAAEVPRIVVNLKNYGGRNRLVKTKSSQAEAGSDLQGSC